MLKLSGVLAQSYKLILNNLGTSNICQKIIFFPPLHRCSGSRKKNAHAQLALQYGQMSPD